MRLNDALITSEKYRGEPTTDDEGRVQWPVFILWDDEIQGFGVRIYPPVRGRPSRKDFIVTWKVGLRTRTMAIGTFGVDCTLRQARRTARDAIDLARRGQDPIEARQRALGIGTAEDLASRFLFEHNAARKKPGVPGGEVATAPASEPDAVAAAPAAPEGSPNGAPAAEAVDAGDTADAASETEAALRSDPTPGEDASSLPIPSSEARAARTARTAQGESSALDFTEPADDPASAAPAEEADEPAALEDEADSESEPEPAVTPASAAQTPVTPARASSAHPPVDRRPRHETGPRATGAPSPPAAPLESRLAEAAPRPLAPPPPPVKRGPTKVRLLPVPEALYKVIEHGARESEMTIAAYLSALVEIARAAVGDAPVSRPSAAADAPPPDETGPSIRELFAQVREAQAVEVGGSDQGDLERDPG